MARSSDKPPARSEALAQLAAVAALACACVLAVSVRLFSVVKYESVIHEFDPYFNFREFCGGGCFFLFSETRGSWRISLCSRRRKGEERGREGAMGENRKGAPRERN